MGLLSVMVRDELDVGSKGGVSGAMLRMWATGEPARRARDMFGLVVGESVRTTRALFGSRRLVLDVVEAKPGRRPPELPYSTPKTLRGPAGGVAAMLKAGR
jgi:hypothetical protein